MADARRDFLKSLSKSIGDEEDTHSFGNMEMNYLIYLISKDIYKNPK